MTFTTDNGPGLKVHQWISNSTGMLAAFALLCHAPSPDNICLYPCTTHQHPESRSEPSSYWIHLHKTWAEVDGLVCSSVGLEEFQCFCAFAMGDESSGCYKHGYLIYRRDAWSYKNGCEGIDVFVIDLQKFGVKGAEKTIVAKDQEATWPSAKPFSSLFFSFFFVFFENHMGNFLTENTKKWYNLSFQLANWHFDTLICWYICRSGAEPWQARSGPPSPHEGRPFCLKATQLALKTLRWGA